MEQLTSSRGRMIEIAMLRRKIEISLTQSQFEAFDLMMVSYLALSAINTLSEKANYYIVHQVYEKRIRPKHLDLKTVFKLKFTIAEACAIHTMLCGICIPNKSIYEETLRNLITSEINQQTT